jgi:hypothetical protein
VDPALVGAGTGVRVENRSIKTPAAKPIAMEDHFSGARTGAGSIASAISEGERIGIELGCSRSAKILWDILSAATLLYVTTVDAAFFFGLSSSLVMVSANASARNGVLRNAQPELSATANSSAGSSEMRTARIWGHMDSNRATTSVAFSSSRMAFVTTT